MEEIWKDIEGYEGYYQVSNLARVKSLSRIINTKNGKIFHVKEMIIKPILQCTGYYSFNLCKSKKRETCNLHRLVAIAFIPNPLNLSQVNHRDEIKTNNSIENLEWCDRSYNRNYGTCQERITNKQRKTLLQMNLNGEQIKEWYSLNSAGRSGFSASKISNCCNGLRKTHKGFIWKYKQ